MKKKMLLPVLFVFVLISACKDNAKQESNKDHKELSAEASEAYIKKGKSIAAATFATLSSKLGKALKEGGVSNAVEVCNLEAYPLVDSLSKVHSATIRRTSLKVRNPKNKANAEELEMLKHYEEQLSSGNPVFPKVVEVDGMVSFYAPIKAQELCLSCHGKVGESVLAADYELIKSLYPDDQAIGYETGDLRGIWSIQFEK